MSEDDFVFVAERKGGSANDGLVRAQLDEAFIWQLCDERSYIEKALAL